MKPAARPDAKLILSLALLAAAWASAGLAPVRDAWPGALRPIDFARDYVAAHARVHGGRGVPPVGEAGNDYGAALGVPRVVLLRMVFNIALDTLVGSIPLLGDIFDLFWRSNRQNLLLLQRCERHPDRPATITDYLVICSAQSEPQIKAIANGVEQALKESHERHPLAVDGFPTSQWIVIDYGDVMFHIFHEQKRPVYALEDLWSDAAQVPVAA